MSNIRQCWAHLKIHSCETTQILHSRALASVASDSRPCCATRTSTSGVSAGHSLAPRAWRRSCVSSRSQCWAGSGQPVMHTMRFSKPGTGHCDGRGRWLGAADDTFRSWRCVIQALTHCFVATVFPSPSALFVSAEAYLASTCVTFALASSPAVLWCCWICSCSWWASSLEYPQMWKRRPLKIGGLASVETATGGWASDPSGDDPGSWVVVPMLVQAIPAFTTELALASTAATSVDNGSKLFWETCSGLTTHGVSIGRFASAPDVAVGPSE
mmetsp:Transcript_87550/g.152430  ORF Transcript_87550/g.152430 Transcript_87550/m.152430 type:complete len:271 (+) Transcript_87550:2134-2946(+)